MDPNILTALSSLGASGQVIAYVAAAITIATALIKLLPAPAAGDGGAYPKLWSGISWIAHLGQPVVKKEPTP